MYSFTPDGVESFSDSALVTEANGQSSGIPECKLRRVRGFKRTIPVRNWL